MGEIILFDRPYWKSFYLMDGKQRWLYTDEKSAIRLKDKEYFNKNTIGIVIYKGFETEKKSKEPISGMIYLICIDYQITNYFGDKSGMHYRNKRYVVTGGNIYQQLEYGLVKEVKRMTKEIKGALSEIERRKIASSGDSKGLFEFRVDIK